MAPFAAALRQQQQQSYSRGGGGDVADDGSPEAAAVTFATFKRFVAAREAALRAAFNVLDQDQDGRISFDDLDTSLSHVAVCCPNTRCVYRTRGEVVHELMSRLDAGTDRWVDQRGSTCRGRLRDS